MFSLLFRHRRKLATPAAVITRTHLPITMADDEDIAALVIDNGSGMCKGTLRFATAVALRLDFDGSSECFFRSAAGCETEPTTVAIP